jgi:hypothetical protein
MRVAVLSFGFQIKGGSRSTSQVEKHKSCYISADKGGDENELPRRNSIPRILSVVYIKSHRNPLRSQTLDASKCWHLRYNPVFFRLSTICEHRMVKNIPFSFSYSVTWGQAATMTITYPVLETHFLKTSSL